MQQHTSMRAAADALSAEAARKTRIAAAQARTKAAQLRRAQRKVRIKSLVQAPCSHAAGHLLAQRWWHIHSMPEQNTIECKVDAVCRAEFTAEPSTTSQGLMRCPAYTAGGGRRIRKGCC